jgi:membrane-associated protease RseP (regulator of RpoE activity)
MKSKQIIAIAEKVINGKMELDYISSLYGSVIFRQEKEKLTEIELNQIQAALFSNGIQSQIQDTNREYLLRLLIEYSKVKKENTRVNLVLFIATIITTTLTGAFFAGSDPFSTLQGLISGVPFAFALLMILGAHEMGHYLYAKKYQIYATLPYFIPFFLPFIFNIGTFGAFIKLRSPIPNKRALFDVGVAGPFAGLAVSLFFLILGFSQLPDLEGVKAYVSQIHPWSDTGLDALTLGNPILFELIRTMMGGTHLPMYETYHFPFIFAGWIGLFVTAINLMPIGQLDGGHITYALFGEKSKFVAIGAFILLAVLAIFSTNWIVWTILILIFIRFKHPPTLNDTIELDPNRRVLAWLSYIIFIVCFTPTPIFLS